MLFWTHSEARVFKESAEQRLRSGLCQACF